MTRFPDPCSAERKGSTIAGMRGLQAPEVTAGIENRPCEGAAFHHIESGVEAVGRDTLAGNGSAQESNEV